MAPMTRLFFHNLIFDWLEIQSNSVSAAGRKKEIKILKRERRVCAVNDDMVDNNTVALCLCDARWRRTKWRWLVQCLLYKKRDGRLSIGCVSTTQPKVEDDEEEKEK